MFQYITFRSACAIILSLIIASVVGKRVIRMLQRQQIGEEIRDLGLQGQMEKKGTPTMGGIIILLAILIPVLLFARLDNVYIQLMIISTIWLGLIGFADDYIKVFRKHKEGLKGRFKVIGQVGLGLIVGLTLYMNDEVVIRERAAVSEIGVVTSTVDEGFSAEGTQQVRTKDIKSTKTTIPFFKDNEFDYAWFTSFAGKYADELGWLLFVLVTIFIITAVSNGANLTDGLDGLAIMPTVFVAAGFALVAWATGNMNFANYLHIPYLRHAGELVIVCTAIVGAGLGFLWFNTYPAQVFMGDVGSLALGGALGIIAVLLRQEFLLVIMGGVFVVETLSVILQVGSFKLRGQRIFRMAPIHHHYELKGWPEPRVIVRFWIISLMLVLIGLATLKVR